MKYRFPHEKTWQERVESIRYGAELTIKTAEIVRMFPHHFDPPDPEYWKEQGARQHRIADSIERLHCGKNN